MLFVSRENEDRKCEGNLEGSMLLSGGSGQLVEVEVLDS